MRILRHRFAAETLAVEEKFDFLAIAVSPDADFLPFLAGPVPVREHMQHRLIRPPGLQIIHAVLGKAADIENAVLRRDGRPAEGHRLAAIIEAGPDAHAGKEWPLGVVRPCVLQIRSPVGRIQS